MLCPHFQKNPDIPTMQWSETLALGLPAMDAPLMPL